MENLPKLPGFNFETRFKSHHGVPHSLDFINGIRVPLKPLKGIGGDPVADDSVAFASESDAAMYVAHRQHSLTNSISMSLLLLLLQFRSRADLRPPQTSSHRTIPAALCAL